MRAGSAINIVIAIMAAVLIIVSAVNVYFFWSTYNGSCPAVGSTNSGWLVLINVVALIVSIVIFVMALVGMFAGQGKSKKMTSAQANALLNTPPGGAGGINITNMPTPPTTYAAPVMEEI